jgi:hypothetical protein
LRRSALFTTFSYLHGLMVHPILKIGISRGIA